MISYRPRALKTLYLYFCKVIKNRPIDPATQRITLKTDCWILYDLTSLCHQIECFFGSSQKFESGLATLKIKLARGIQKLTLIIASSLALVLLLRCI